MGTPVFNESLPIRLALLRTQRQLQECGVKDKWIEYLAVCETERIMCQGPSHPLLLHFPRVTNDSFYKVP